MPRKSAGAPSTYIRPAADRICPQLRRRATRAGRRAARSSASPPTASRTTSPARTRSVRPGLRSRADGPRSRSRRRCRRSPSRPSRGRRPSARRSFGRASRRDHSIGSVHCVFRFGPVGPLKNACCSSPQRPSNAIQGNAFAPPRGRSESSAPRAAARRAARGCRRSRPRPPPSCRGRGRAVYLFACDPAAG